MKFFNNNFENFFKIQTADLPTEYNWDVYATRKIWQNFRWQYKDNDGEYKDLPGRKDTNGEWPCIDEYILDNWMSQGKIETQAML